MLKLLFPSIQQLSADLNGKGAGLQQISVWKERDVTLKDAVKRGRGTGMAASMVTCCFVQLRQQIKTSRNLSCPIWLLCLLGDFSLKKLILLLSFLLRSAATRGLERFSSAILPPLPVSAGGPPRLLQELIRCLLKSRASCTPEAEAE